MSHRLILSAACAALLGGAAMAQEQDLPDFPTAAAPPPGDAFPAKEVEFPNGVVATADVTYDTQVGYCPLTLDIYRQPDAGEARPLVLYIHSGGWKRSHKRPPASSPTSRECSPTSHPVATSPLRPSTGSVRDRPGADRHLGQLGRRPSRGPRGGRLRR